MSHIVLCHGVFDLLHLGHIRHLEEARSFGDKLIVSVVPDKFAVKRVPIFNETERMAMLNSLKCVDGVFLCGAPGPELLIKFLNPNVYVRGGDYAGKLMPESYLLESLGIEVRYTEYEPSHKRTSEIIERIRCL